MIDGRLDRFRTLYRESEKRQAGVDHELELAEKSARIWAETVTRLNGQRKAEVDLQEWLVSQIGGEP